MKAWQSLDDVLPETRTDDEDQPYGPVRVHTRHAETLVEGPAGTASLPGPPLSTPSG